MEFFVEVFAEACCWLCSSIDCCNISNNVRFNSNRKALDKESETLEELRHKVEHEVQTSEEDGKSVNSQVKEWLGEVEKCMVEVKTLESSMKDYERRQQESRCSCHCSQRFKFSKEVGMFLKEVRRLTSAGGFKSGVVNHGTGLTNEDKEKA